MPFTDRGQITESLNDIVAALELGQHKAMERPAESLLVDLHRLIEPIDHPDDVEPGETPRPTYGADQLGVSREKVLGLYEKVNLAFRNLSPTENPANALREFRAAREYWFAE